MLKDADNLAENTSRQTDQSDVEGMRREILQALSVDMPPVETTLWYKMSMFAVAAANLLLPLLYLCIVFLLGHAVYWHARFNSPFDARGTSLISIIIYFVVLIAGMLTVFFLVKPLFHRASDNSVPQRLKRSAEPFLYEYIEHVCRAVNAPAPKSIRVVIVPNAFASFRHGLLSLFNGELTLTIGLPLVAGMTLRQLTGILAHEFGHFSQGAGMRMSYVIQTVNHWLLRIVYTRDNWDEKLDRACHFASWRGKMFLYPTRICIWLSRQLMFGLVWLGNAISCFLLRQMEFDADRYETGIVGWKTFSKSSFRVTELAIAHEFAMSDLEHFYNEGRLAESLPLLCVASVPLITPEFRKKIAKVERERKTGLFDTHPTNRERVIASRESRVEGVFRLRPEHENLPATILFHNFKELSRLATIQYYELVLKEKFNRKLLHSVDSLVERRRGDHEAAESLDRYFQVHIPIDRPLPIAPDADKPPANPRETVVKVQESRAKMLKMVEEYKKLTKRYDFAESVLFSTVEAVSMIECGLSIHAADYGLPNGKLKTANAKYKRARQGVEQLAARMYAFESVASDRLSDALKLLQHPKIAERIPDGAKLQADARRLIPMAIFISKMINELPTLRVLHRRIDALLSRLGRDAAQNHEIISFVIEQLEKLHLRLSSIQEDLSGKPYPFDHATKNITLRTLVIPELPESNDLSGMCQVTYDLVRQLFVLQVRLFAALAFAAEKVETVIGLPQLPPMPSENEQS